MGGSALVVACVVLLAAQSAIGANPDELARRIKSGSQVFVIDWTGAERGGKVISVRADRLELQRPGGSIMIPLNSIAQIDRPDRWWDGLLIGAAIGGALVTLTKAGCQDAQLHRDPKCLVSGRLRVVASSSLIALAIDHARHGRSVVYRARR